jgi:hypothetical protein
MILEETASKMEYSSVDLSEILLLKNLLVTGCTSRLNILTIVLSAYTVFISEQAATCAIYIKNIVFITELKSVYSVVGIGPLNEAVCAPSFKG